MARRTNEPMPKRTSADQRRRQPSPSRDARRARSQAARTPAQSGRAPSRRTRQTASPSRDAQAYRRRTRARSQKRRGNSLVRPLVLLALVVAVVCVIRLIACAPQASSGSVVDTSVSVRDLYNSPYDWSCLTDNGSGRLAYVKDGEVLSREGVDVSEHQDEIDWQQVASDGISFAMVRVGYRTVDNGTLMEDAYAQRNLDGAAAAGLDLGAYFYSQATTEDEAREEADFALSVVGSRTLAYPIVFDFEQGNIAGERIENMTTEQRMAVAKAFCERITESGHRAMIYGNASGLMGFDVEQLVDWGFWYAEYTSEPTSSLRFALWQYSETGDVAGISGGADLNLDLTGVWRAQ